MVAELENGGFIMMQCCSLAKISMVAERKVMSGSKLFSCSLAKISMVAEP